MQTLRSDLRIVSERCEVKGIQYVVDENGNRTAVVIDLAEHGELWEDLYDAYLANERASEPVEPFDDVINRLRGQGKLDGNE